MIDIETTLRKERAVARRKATRAENELRDHQTRLVALVAAHQGVCKVLGVDDTISNDDLLKLLKKKLDGEDFVDVDIQKKLAAVYERQQTTARGLGLDPEKATNTDITDKLVELSDYGLAGKQLLELLAAELSIPLPTRPEVIVATVKGLRALLAEYESAKTTLKSIVSEGIVEGKRRAEDAQQLAAHKDDHAIDTGNTAHDQLRVALNQRYELCRTLHLADATEHATIVQRVQEIVSAAAMWDAAAARVQQLHTILGTQPGDGLAAVIEEVESLRKIASEYSTSVYFGENMDTLLDGLKELLGLPNDADSDPQEYLATIEHTMYDNNDLKARLNVAEAELTLKTAEADKFIAAHRDVCSTNAKLWQQNDMMKNGVMRLITLVEVAGDVARDLTRHMKDVG